jgi:tRNA (cmo5U34)-methyltransferase
MSQFHFFPELYLDLITQEVPAYPTMQDTVGEMAVRPSGLAPGRVLDLGTGTGETARRVVARHPAVELVGIDASADMLEAARTQLGDADLRCQKLEDPLPDGPFDVVISALAVHHLDAPGKADLFARIHDALNEDGRFVMADVVVTDDPADMITPLDATEDRPDRLDDQLLWLRDAGFTPHVVWQSHDLVVITADRQAQAKSGNGATTAL